jgi:hypothetical protein
MAAASPPSGYLLSTRSNVLLPALLAWVSTVGVPVAERGTGFAARASAGLALLALVGGPLLLPLSPRYGRIVGIHVALGLSVLTWLLLGDSMSVLHLEPVRSAIGVVAWILFAFGWGATRFPGQIPEDDPRAILGPPLLARSRLPFGAAFIFGAGLFGAALPLFAAWRVARPSHALLAHAVAIVCGIALVTSAARVAVDRQGWQPVSPAAARLGLAARPLTLLAVVVIVRLIWMLIR